MEGHGALENLVLDSEKMSCAVYESGKVTSVSFSRDNSPDVVESGKRN